MAARAGPAAPLPSPSRRRGPRVKVGSARSKHPWRAPWWRRRSTCSTLPRLLSPFRRPALAWARRRRQPAATAASPVAQGARPSPWTESDEACCRFCLCATAEPLFAPCKCAGSMRLVHPSCLQAWRATSAAALDRCAVCAFQYVTDRPSALDFVRSRGRSLASRGLRHLAEEPCRNMGCVETRVLLGVLRFGLAVGLCHLLFAALSGAALGEAWRAPTDPRDVVAAALLVTHRRGRRGRPAAVHDLLALLRVLAPRCGVAMAVELFVLLPTMLWALRSALHGAGLLSIEALTPLPLSGGGFALNLGLLALAHCACSSSAHAWAAARLEFCRWRAERSVVVPPGKEKFY